MPEPIHASGSWRLFVRRKRGHVLSCNARTLHALHTLRSLRRSWRCDSEHERTAPDRRIGREREAAPDQPIACQIDGRQPFVEDRERENERHGRRHVLHHGRFRHRNERHRVRVERERHDGQRPCQHHYHRRVDTERRERKRMMRRQIAEIAERERHHHDGFAPCADDRVPRRPHFARKAEQRLKALLQRYPQTDLRPTVEAHLREVQDNLAMHNLQVARFYYDARYIHKKGGLKGSQDRLREIVEKYPNFCLMDEVLFRFASTFQEEEEPDEAAKLYQQLVRDYPNSEYIDKAKDQLNVIGASIPDPDPIKKDITPCEKPGFMANMMQQITGSANISTSHDGILITHNGEGTDLIDRAIANGGELPENVQPVIHTTNPATAERPRTTATPKP